MNETKYEKRIALLKSQYTDLLQEFSRTMNRERTHFKRQTDQSIRRINRSLKD